MENPRLCDDGETRVRKHEVQSVVSSGLLSSPTKVRLSMPKQNRIADVTRTVDGK